MLGFADYGAQGRVAEMMAAEHTNDRREVKWNLFLQYSTVGLMLVQGVLLVPLYLRFVGSEEFGVWLVASGVATWIGIVGPGVATLVQQRISQALGGARPGRAVQFARQGLRLNSMLAVIVIAIGAAGSGWLLHLIDPRAQVPTADLFVIGRFFDGGMVTSHALTKRPVDLLLGLFQRPAVALSPTVSFLLGSEKTERLGEVVAQACLRLPWALGGAALGTLFLLQPLVALWVGPLHYLGGHAAWILAVALVANAFSGFFANLYWAAGATTNYCQINSGLCAVAIIGILIGFNFFGVTGLMVGALLPRLLLATWLFPRLAMRALNLKATARHAIWRETAAVAAAWAVGGGIALAARHAAISSPWWQGLAGLAAYGGALGLLSGELRREVRSLVGGARA